jgi:hypothetical protein
MEFFKQLERRLVRFLAHPQVVISLVVLLAVYGAYLFVWVAGHSPLPDFTVYLRASEAMVEGRNIYTTIYRVEYIPGTFFRLSYLYPPLLAHLLSKATPLGDPTIKMLWSGMSFVALVVSVYHLSTLLCYSWWREVSIHVRLLFISFLVLCFEPIPCGVGYGQVTALVLCLLTTFMHESIRRRDLTAGLALAFAIHIKMTPVVLLLAPIAFRRWRTVGWCLGGVAAGTLFTVVETGSIAPCVDFLNSLATTSNHPGIRGNEFNFSMEGVLLLPLGLFQHRFLRQALPIAMLICTVVVVKLLPKRDERDYLVTSAFLILCMVMASPIIWFHHFAWLVVPIVVAMMVPAETPELRMKNLATCMGILFGFSKVFLIHANVITKAAALMNLSALLPVILAIWLGRALCAPYLSPSTLSQPRAIQGMRDFLLHKR